jgi:hypothetical protein
MDQATSEINPMLDPRGAGANLLRQGKFGEAATVLREATAIDPGDEEAFSLLGAALASKGDSDQAVEAFKRAAELGAGNPRNHFNLGLAYQASKRLPEARLAFEKALTLNPGYDQARARLTELAQQMGATVNRPTPTASAEGHTNIKGGGDSSMLQSVGNRYTPPVAGADGHTNIAGGGDATSLASIGQKAAPPPAQEGHTNIGGGSGNAGAMLSGVGVGRAPVIETGHTNIGGGATAASAPAPAAPASAPPSVSPVLRSAPSSAPPSSSPSSVTDSINAPRPQLGMNYASNQENSSGMQGDVPSEVASGFNWGAFLMTWLWLLNMRVTTLGLGVLSIYFAIGLISYFLTKSGSGTTANPASMIFNLISNGLQLAISIYLGMNGNKLAWPNRRFESVDDFRACQRIWVWWGVGLIVAGIIIGVLLVVLLGAIFVGLSSGSK